MGVRLKAVPDQADVRNYRSAFSEFAQKVRQARALMNASNPDRQAIDAALLELEKARVAYNHRRDVLAQHLLNSGPAAFEPPGPSADWELAGKPDGTAEDDWFRAEEIVRRSAAA
jgi:hypothetical protein